MDSTLITKWSSSSSTVGSVGIMGRRWGVVRLLGPLPTVSGSVALPGALTGSQVMLVLVIWGPLRWRGWWQEVGQPEVEVPSQGAMAIALVWQADLRVAWGTGWGHNQCWVTDHLWERGQRGWKGARSLAWVTENTEATPAETAEAAWASLKRTVMLDGVLDLECGKRAAGREWIWGESLCMWCQTSWYQCTV